jgi:hypothetical protein
MLLLDSGLLSSISKDSLLEWLSFILLISFDYSEFVLEDPELESPSSDSLRHFWKRQSFPTPSVNVFDYCVFSKFDIAFVLLSHLD